jgi:hypothetical protein
MNATAVPVPPQIAQLRACLEALRIIHLWKLQPQRRVLNAIYAGTATENQTKRIIHDLPSILKRREVWRQLGVPPCQWPDSLRLEVNRRGEVPPGTSLVRALTKARQVLNNTRQAARNLPPAHPANIIPALATAPPP